MDFVKILMRPAVSAAVVLALSCAALAETREERFARIDADHDGAVSLQEHAAADQADLLKLDADGDRSVTLKEYVEHLRRRNPAFAGPAAASVARCYFRTVDAKADDSVSAEDIRAYNERVFRWLAGADERMTLEESKRTPPPEVIPRVVCR